MKKLNSRNCLNQLKLKFFNWNIQRTMGIESLSCYELMLINEIRTKDIAIEKVSKMLEEK